MEKRINKKLENYITDFKNNLREKIDSTLFVDIEKDKNNILQYIYDYERLNISKEDFSKRKRVKNTVPLFDRCCAKRASNEQCTRKKKTGFEYCGTHIKGTPHGIVLQNDENIQTTNKIEVWAQEIQGIIYFIDDNENVYRTEDIASNICNPKIIAKYVKVADIYTIPEFNI